MWQGNEVYVKGVLNGTIDTDTLTPKDNIVVEDNAKINGDVNINENTKTITLIFKDIEEVDGYFWEVRKFIYTDKTQLTQQEFFLQHQVEIDNYKLEYYTDTSFQNKWDYLVNDNITIYGKWVEHTHTFDGSFVLHDNAIYEQCSCGHLGKKLSLNIPTDLYYSGNRIETVIDNELSLEGYTIKYQAMNKDGVFVDIEGVPVKVGTYKAILTYDDMAITSEYSIIEKPINPSTGIITPYIICGLIAIVSLVGINLCREKKFM